MASRVRQEVGNTIEAKAYCCLGLRSYGAVLRVEGLLCLLGGAVVCVVGTDNVVLAQVGANLHLNDL